MIKKSRIPRRLPPLRQPVTLYVNRTRESRAAERFLKASGVKPILVSDGSVEPNHRKPLAIWAGSMYSYQGLAEIKQLPSDVRFWAKRAIDPIFPLFGSTRSSVRKTR